MQVTGNNQTHYNLSIRITADGFSFYVTETYSGDLLQHEDFEVRDDEQLAQTLTKAITRPSISCQEYNNVRVVIDSDSTCIPIDEFRNKDLEKYYKMVFSQANLERNKVCYTLFQQFDIVEAFTIPHNVYSVIREHFPGVIFTSSHTMVLQRVISHYQRRKTDAQTLFAYVQSGIMFVFSLQANKLLFANQFTINDKEQNALFFLLAVWKELKLDEQKDYCYIGGAPLSAQRLTEGVRKYLANIEQMGTVDFLFHP